MGLLGAGETVFACELAHDGVDPEGEAVLFYLPVRKVTNGLAAANGDLFVVDSAFEVSASAFLAGYVSTEHGDAEGCSTVEVA